MIDFKVVYMCNCTDKWMRTYLKYAVLSTLRFVPKENIDIIFHPPLMNLDEINNTFGKLGNLIIHEDLVADPWASHPKNKDNERWYTEVTRICDVEDDNILFLECDTLTCNDPTKMMEGDFDFAAIPMNKLHNHWTQRQRIKTCVQNKFKLNPKRTQVWSACMLGFKNGAHHRLGKEWRRSDIEDKALMNVCFPPNRKIYTQVSLIRAVANSDVKIREYALNDEVYVYTSIHPLRDMNKDICVVHGNELFSKLGLKDELDELYKEF